MYWFFIAAVPLFLSGSIYAGIRLNGFLVKLFPRIKKGLFWIIYLVFPFLFIASTAMPVSGLAMFLTNVGYLYMGTLLYAFLFLIVAELVRLVLFILRKLPKDGEKRRRLNIAAGYTVCIAVLLTVGGGNINTKIIHTEQYNIVIDKSFPQEDLRVVAVSDLHFGYQIGATQAKRTVEAINAATPDVVFFVGDIFDGDTKKVFDLERIQGILSGIKSNYGVFAVLGNHDRPSFETERFFAESNITLLTDKTVLIDNSFYIVGRNDRSYIGGGRDDREKLSVLMKDFDTEKPIIVLDHRPDTIDEPKERGADLLLCGHSHAGQVFPANLITKRVYENDYGYARFGGMHMIVTSGAGHWGPPLRVGTKAEIVLINISFSG